ncbi:pentapeptide repeat-containing protein [Polaribacter sp. MED152]|uniref:pentapeptide repeat-containing protein n=1 Tax=Polaribacter sp. MED152 TaxID=313598 RepID=UPI000068CC4C|nr:pentapeptide repeat-containing protein [Polaribacter sp. MED152]EAQ41725.1 hypothetical protein MED152_03385 [Polaribacter sp. MED152]
MKIKFTLLTILFLSLSLTAQNKIDAATIMEDIANGKDINYTNKTIVGTLDFTYMEEALKKLPKRKKKNSWWGNGNYSNSIEKDIDVKISFTNCVFRDDVLAYIPDEDSGYTFTADFEESVIFTNCNFEGKAMFKYSDFDSDSDFSGSIFSEDTTFKYAKFDREISFENTKFVEVSTFKYSEFRRNVSFAGSVFEDSAIFKYTKFKDGVSFRNVNFEEDLNIKYMNVSGDFDISNMNVGYDIDSKYTKINGKSFSKYLLNVKN